MTKIILTDLVNLQNETTAVNALKANNAVIVAAIDNTLSRDGTSPNTLLATLDANSQKIINLPVATATGQPVTYEVFNNAVIAKGNVPLGGTTGQVLAKTSGVDYATAWTSESAELTAGSNIVLTGTTPTTIATTATPTFTTVSGGTTAGSSLTLQSTSNVAPSGDNVNIYGSNVTARTAPGLGGQSTLNVGTASQTAGQLVIAGASSGATTVIPTSAASGTLTLPATTDTLVGKATTDTLTNKTLTSPTLTTPVLGTPASGNLANCTAFPVGGITGLGTGVSAALQQNVNSASGLAPTASPTLVTPTLGAAIATSVNKVALTAPATAATLTMANNTTLTTTTSTSVGAGQYLATSTNDTATAGNIGEFVTSTVLTGSAVTLSTGVTSNVTSISLTAGDWDVYGGVVFVPTATTATFLDGAITTTTATLPTVDGLTCTQWSNSAGQALGSSSISIPTNFSRISISGTTTVFLVAQGTFSAGTLKAFGMISARRVR